MKIVRRFCSLGHRLRQDSKLPVSYPLLEVEFNGVEEVDGAGHFLWKEEYQLIADDLNCFEINPFITEHAEGEWISIKDGTYKLALRIDKTDLQERLYKLSRDRREEAQKRKSLGLVQKK